MYFFDYWIGQGLSSEAAAEYATRSYTAEMITYSVVVLAAIVVVCFALAFIFGRRK